MRVCASKPKENLPNPLCDGAITGTKKCISGTMSATCIETGWKTDNCNIFTEQCFENKCEKKKEYYQDHPRCTSTNYLTKETYDSKTACPEGLSCNRYKGICETPEKLTTKKVTGSTCNTDADCESGYCKVEWAGGEVSLPIMHCSNVTDKEEVTRDAKTAAIVLIAGIGAPFVAGASSFTGLTGVALNIANWMANNPKAASWIQGGLAALNIASDVDCIANPNGPGCQEQAMLSALGLGFADDVADVVDSGYGFKNLFTKSVAKKAADTLVDAGEAAVDITDDIVVDDSLRLFSNQLDTPITSTKIPISSGQKYVEIISNQDGTYTLKVASDPLQSVRVDANDPRVISYIENARKSVEGLPVEGDTYRVLMDNYFAYSKTGHLGGGEAKTDDIYVRAKSSGKDSADLGDFIENSTGVCFESSICKSIVLSDFGVNNYIAVYGDRHANIVLGKDFEEAMANAQWSLGNLLSNDFFGPKLEGVSPSDIQIIQLMN